MWSARDISYMYHLYGNEFVDSWSMYAYYYDCCNVVKSIFFCLIICIFFRHFFFGYKNQPAKKENINEWILCIWYFVLQICVYGLFSSKMFSFDAAKLLVCFEKIRLKTFSIHIAHATEHIFYDFTTFQDILFIFFDSVRVVVVLFWQKSYEGKYLLNHL